VYDITHQPLGQVPSLHNNFLYSSSQYLVSIQVVVFWSVTV